MQTQVKIVAIDHDQVIAKNGGGSYKGTRITYRESDGSLKEKCIHSNALKYNPTLKNQLNEVKSGDDVTLVLEKEGDFWNLKEVTKGVPQSAVASNGNGGGAKNGSAANASPRSTYETPEERAKRQVLIVRQSSVSSAIAYAATQKSQMKIEDVLKIAEQINAFVFDTEFDDGSIESLPSDTID